MLVCGISITIWGLLMTVWGLLMTVWVFHVNSGSCNGCDIEIIAALTPKYDVERFGIRLVGSPRHADFLFCSVVKMKLYLLSLCSCFMMYIVYHIYLLLSREKCSIIHFNRKKMRQFISTSLHPDLSGLESGSFLGALKP